MIYRITFTGGKQGMTFRNFTNFIQTVIEFTTINPFIGIEYAPYIIADTHVSNTEHIVILTSDAPQDLSE